MIAFEQMSILCNAGARKAITGSRKPSSFFPRRALMQFDCGTRILRVVHGRDARVTFANCISTSTSYAAAASEV